MNNVDLHLIKGRPAVHPDDDLIVSHIAMTVRGDKMNELRERLQKMGTAYRKNVSVPNPTVTKGFDKGRTDQVWNLIKTLLKSKRFNEWIMVFELSYTSLVLIKLLHLGFCERSRRLLH